MTPITRRNRRWAGEFPSIFIKKGFFLREIVRRKKFENSWEDRNFTDTLPSLAESHPPTSTLVDLYLFYFFFCYTKEKLSEWPLGISFSSKMSFDGCHRQLLLSLLFQVVEEIQVRDNDADGSCIFFDSSNGTLGVAQGGNSFNSPYNDTDNSPTSYENKIHVSEIYGNSRCISSCFSRSDRVILGADDKHVPSDNPTTNTIFSSMLRKWLGEHCSALSLSLSLEQTKESTQQATVNQYHSDGVTSSTRESVHRPPPHPSTLISTNRSFHQRDATHAMHKHWNSCSTIYVDDSTVSQPNWKAMIKCVSIAIHSHIMHRKSNQTMVIFDEKLHPLTVSSSLKWPSLHSRKPPWPPSRKIPYPMITINRYPTRKPSIDLWEFSSLLHN